MGTGATRHEPGIYQPGASGRRRARARGKRLVDSAPPFPGYRTFCARPSARLAHGSRLAAYAIACAVLEKRPEEFVHAPRRIKSF